jgi:hypothetical protein
MRYLEHELPEGCEPLQVLNSKNEPVKLFVDKSTLLPSLKTDREIANLTDSNYDASAVYTTVIDGNGKMHICALNKEKNI